MCDLCKEIKSITPKDREYIGEDTVVIRQGMYSMKFLMKLPFEQGREDCGLQINYCPICGRKIWEYKEGMKK